MTSALTVYALCVVVLFLKMFAISCYQGLMRIRFRAFTNAEDAAVSIESLVKRSLRK